MALKGYHSYRGRQGIWRWLLIAVLLLAAVLIAAISIGGIVRRHSHKTEHLKKFIQVQVKLLAIKTTMLKVEKHHG